MAVVASRSLARRTTSCARSSTRRRACRAGSSAGRPIARRSPSRRVTAGRPAASACPFGWWQRRDAHCRRTLVREDCRQCAARQIRLRAV